MGADCSYSHLAHANDLEPAPGHHHLIDHCPVHLETAHEPPFYVVSRHADVFSVLTQPDVWNNGEGPGVFYQPGGVLGAADGDDHRRQRRVLQDSFRPRVIELLMPELEAIGERLWADAFGADGEGEFVELFAFPFPAIAIALLLGVPADRRHDFGAWSNDIVNGLGGGDLRRADAALVGIYGIVDAMVAERIDLAEAGAALPDDVVSVLTRAHVDGVLSYGEVRRLCQQLLVAGHETTASLIGLMLYRLIERPELVAQLRADTSLLAPAVEEFLRFDSPVQGLFRTSPAACPIGDTEIPAHTKVQVMFAAANRDPRMWDDPDEIRIDRALGGTRPHLAFGWGIHHCIGAPLARAVGQIALSLMVNRFEHVELVGATAVNQPFILRGLTTLPIRWANRIDTT